MAKTQEELNILKKEYESMNLKLKELTEEELKLVTGGVIPQEHNIFISSELNNNKPNGDGGAI